MGHPTHEEGEIMTRALAVAAMVCAALLGARQTQLLGQTIGSDRYEMAVRTWEKYEKLPLDAAARNVVIESFDRHKGDVADFGGDHRWTGSQNSAAQTLVAYYLSNVRDVKLEGKSRGGFEGLPNKKVLGDTRDAGAVSPSARNGFTIELSDVDHYTVDQFFKDLRPLLNSAKGELHVVSDPSGARITLDTADRGFTEKTSVEKAGDHEIVVRGNTLSCSSKITVPAGGSYTYHCP
jgi:PEGA domain